MYSQPAIEVGYEGHGIGALNPDNYEARIVGQCIRCAGEIYEYETSEDDLCPGCVEDLRLVQSLEEDSAELIVVKQLPIIEAHLESVSPAIDEKLAFVESLICSEDNLRQVEAIRAEFNKERGELEDLKKSVKQSISAPYKDFEKVYNEKVGDKYKAADAVLKAKITAVRDELRVRKLAAVRDYYNEYAISVGVSDYADFERHTKDLRTSYSEKEFQRICRERLDAIASGLKAINEQPEDVRAEILAEFRKTLKSSEAIAVVGERRRAIENARRLDEERKQREASEKECVARVEAAVAPLAPPTAATVTHESKKHHVAFELCETKEVISALVRHMRENGIIFKQIPMSNTIKNEEVKSA